VFSTLYGAYSTQLRVVNETVQITVASGPSSILQLVQGFQFGNGGDHDTTPGFVCLSVCSSNFCRAEDCTNNETGSSFDAFWNTRNKSLAHE